MLFWKHYTILWNQKGRCLIEGRWMMLLRFHLAINVRMWTTLNNIQHRLKFEACCDCKQDSLHSWQIWNSVLSNLARFCFCFCFAFAFSLWSSKAKLSTTEATNSFRTFLIVVPNHCGLPSWQIRSKRLRRWLMVEKTKLCGHEHGAKWQSIQRGDPRHGYGWHIDRRRLWWQQR